MRIRSLPGTLVLVAGILAAGALAPVPATAKVGLQLTLPVGGACLSGYKPNFDRIRVKLLRSDGTARETAHDDNANYDWALCFHHVPVPGDKLQMINGTALDRTVTVPHLTVQADRVTNLVSGRGPAGKDLQLAYLDCYPAGCLGHAYVVSVNSNGRYHDDLSTSSVDIDGSDEVNILYQTALGDQFTSATAAPYFELTKPNQLFLSCLPRGTSTVRLLTAGGTLRASRSFHATKDCSGSFGSFRKDGHAVSVHIGDKITSDLATDARLVWPSMSVEGQGTTLSGKCLADSRYVVFVSRGSTSSPFGGTTGSDGHFTKATAWTFQAGDTLDLTCESNRGDRVRMSRTL